jgi:DNA-directed RNA polymerase subunit RPC12/RpoP
MFEHPIIRGMIDKNNEEREKRRKLVADNKDAKIKNLSTEDEKEKEKEKTRPWTRCSRCNTLNYFEHLDPIKCSSCDYRVVNKERPRISYHYICR